jgi:hypothetical protein
LPTAHLDPTVARIFSSNKTDTRFSPLNPSALTPFAPRRNSPSDGTVTGPLASACARRWVDAPPSSGSLTEPYPHASSWSSSGGGSCSRGDHASSHQGAGERRTNGSPSTRAVHGSSQARARQHLSHGAPSTDGDHGEARAHSRSCASRSIHPECGSTTVGGSGNGIFTQR